jgi:hypothetical protein
VLSSICARRPWPDFISSSCFTPDSDLVFFSVACPSLIFVHDFRRPDFVSTCALAFTVATTGPDFISMSIPLKGFRFPLFIFCCRRHQLRRISAQLLVFRGAGSLHGVFSQSLGALRALDFRVHLFSLADRRPGLPLDKEHSPHSSKLGFGLFITRTGIWSVHRGIFYRHSSTRFLTGAHPRGRSLSLIDFLVHSSVDFLPVCLSSLVLCRVFSLVVAHVGQDGFPHCRSCLGSWPRKHSFTAECTRDND